MRSVRSYFAKLLGVRDEAARNGDWWEIDFIIVLLGGVFAAGVIGWFQL
jgi:hypothetical protein